MLRHLLFEWRVINPFRILLGILFSLCNIEELTAFTNFYGQKCIVHLKS